MPDYATFNTTTRLGTKVDTLPAPPSAPGGHTVRLLTTPEYTLIDSINGAGNKWVVDGSNVVRVATAAETDNAFTPRQYFLKRIPEMSVAARPAAYQTGLLVEFALLAKDKPGATECVNVSTLSAGAKTKANELIASYVFPS